MKLEEGFFSFHPRKAHTRTEITKELLGNNDFMKYLSQFYDQELDVTLVPTVNYTEKQNMYRYYHKAVLSSAIVGFTRLGYEGMDKAKADHLLKEACARNVMHRNGKAEYYHESKEGMNKIRLHRFLSDCIQYIEQELEQEVLGADEFKTLMNEGKAKK